MGGSKVRALALSSCVGTSPIICPNPVGSISYSAGSTSRIRTTVADIAANATDLASQRDDGSRFCQSCRGGHAAEDFGDVPQGSSEVFRERLEISERPLCYPAGRGSPTSAGALRTWPCTCVHHRRPAPPLAHQAGNGAALNARLRKDMIVPHLLRLASGGSRSNSQRHLSLLTTNQSSDP